MGKVNVLNQAESFISESYITQLHSNANKKPTNEAILFWDWWKEKIKEKTEQDWRKICWKEVENE